MGVIALLDSVELGLLIELGYAILTEHTDVEGRAKLDSDLEALNGTGTAQVVKMARNAYGKMVPVTEDRMRQAQDRNARMAQATRR